MHVQAEKLQQPHRGWEARLGQPEALRGPRAGGTAWSRVFLPRGEPWSLGKTALLRAHSPTKESRGVPAFTSLEKPQSREPQPLHAPEIGTTNLGSDLLSHSCSAQGVVRNRIAWPIASQWGGAGGKARVSVDGVHVGWGFLCKP